MVTGEKRIQAYVDLSTYESLKSQAKDRNMSLSELVADILQAHSMVDSSSNTSSSDISSLTEEELILILEEFRRGIIDEMSKINFRSEVTSDILLGLKSEVTKMTAILEENKKNFSSSGKEKKGFENK